MPPRRRSSAGAGSKEAAPPPDGPEVRLISLSAVLGPRRGRPVPWRGSSRGDLKTKTFACSRARAPGGPSAGQGGFGCSLVTEEPCAEPAGTRAARGGVH